MRTPIAYYGGKQAIISHLKQLIPPHEVYTEVFFGGGTLFWSKEPSKNETINDKLDIVINFYRVLKSDFDQLKTLIDSTLISRTQHKNALKIIKNKKSHSNLNLAWAFWICSNFSYSNKIGGGIKYSNDQDTVVPMALRNKKKRFTEKLTKRIESAYIENEDALKILKSRNVKETFHYLDPPYPNADQGHYSGYTFDDLKLLLDFLQNECKGKFLLSNYNSDMLDAYIKRNGWYKKEITHKLKAPRKSGKVKTEVLVWNYNLENQQKLNFDAA